MRYICVFICFIAFCGCSNQSHKAKECFEIGKRQFDSSDYRNCILQFDAAIKLKPDYAEAYALRGYAKMKLLFKDALKDFDMAIKLDSSQSKFYYYRGLYKYEFRADSKGALVDFRKEVKFSPLANNGWRLKGQMESKLGKTENALNSFSRALELYPSDTKAYLYRSLLYNRERKTQPALADIRIAYSIDSFDVEIVNCYGYLLGVAGKYDSAIMYLNRASYLKPNYALAYNNRAYSEIQLGRFGKAKEDVDISLRLNHRNAYAYRNKALYLLKIKRHAEVCAQIDSGLKYTFGDQYIKSNLDSLRIRHCE